MNCACNYVHIRSVICKGPNDLPILSVYGHYRSGKARFNMSFFLKYSVCVCYTNDLDLVLVDAYVYMCNSSCFGIYHEYLFMMAMLSC